MFYDELSELLAIMQTLNDTVILRGDLNCPGMSGQALNESLPAVNFSQLVKSATRDDQILDIIAVSDNCLQKISGTVVIDSNNVSDHTLVITNIQTSANLKPSKVTKTYRDFNHCNFKLLEELLNNSELILNPATSVEQFVCQMDYVVNRMLDVVAPFRTVTRTVNKGGSLNFLNSAAAAAKRRRRALERRWRASKLPNDKTAYR